MPTYDLSSAGGDAALLVERAGPYDLGGLGSAEFLQDTLGVDLTPNTEGGAQTTPYLTKYLKAPVSYVRQRITATFVKTAGTQRPTLILRSEQGQGSVRFAASAGNLIIGSVPTGDNPTPTNAISITSGALYWRDLRADGTVHRMVAEVRENSTTGCVVNGIICTDSTLEWAGLARATVPGTDFDTASAPGFTNTNVVTEWRNVTVEEITEPYYLECVSNNHRVNRVYKGYDGSLIQCNFVRLDGHTTNLTISLVAYDGGAVPTGISIETLDSNYAAKSTFTSSDTSCFIRISASAAAATDTAGKMYALRCTDGSGHYDEVIVLHVHDFAAKTANTQNARFWGSSSSGSSSLGMADEVSTAYSGYITGWTGSTATDAVSGTSFADWFPGSANLHLHLTRCVETDAVSLAIPVGSNSIVIGDTWNTHKALAKPIIQELVRRIPHAAGFEIGYREDGNSAGVTGTVVSIDGTRTIVTLSAGFSAVNDAYNGYPLRITEGGLFYYRTIVDYDGATKAATVDSAFPSGLTYTGDVVSNLTSLPRLTAIQAVNAGFATLANSAHADFVQYGSGATLRQYHFHENGYTLASRDGLQSDQIHQGSPQNTARDYWRDTYRWWFQRMLSNVVSPSTWSLNPGATKAFTVAISAATAGEFAGMPLNTLATNVPTTLDDGAWSATRGTIDTDGDPYTAPAAPGADTVFFTFTYGLNYGSAAVTVNDNAAGGGGAANGGGPAGKLPVFGPRVTSP